MPTECQQLIDLARPRMTRSGVMNPDGTGYSDIRTSSGCAFARNETPLIAKLFRDVADDTGRDPATFEAMQMVHYGPGEEYRAHVDHFHPGQASSESAMQAGGNRTGTFMAYLQTPDAGGDTLFPEAGGLRIAAIAGDAVFFAYAAGTDHRTSHAGMPVITGEKWIFNIFMRERPIQ